MTGFVDDCAQRVNCFASNPQPQAERLLTLMENDAQIWNDLLWSSGGALEQSKCSFHLVESQWNANGHPFLKGGVGPRSIMLFHQGRRTLTTQKSNYEAHKTLGCHISPAFTRTQTWFTIENKNEKLSQLLETNFFTRPESWTFYISVYLPSITYPLPITPLTKMQCHRLDSRFLRTLMPRCGYNRNMSRAVRYAPLYMGGAGFKELYAEQGALMLQHLYKHLNSPETTIGRMLVIALSWTQAFLGTSKFFLEHVQHPIPPAGPSWLLDIRTFLQEIKGSIKFHNAPVPELLRENDRFLMDIVLQQQLWNNSQVMQINSCRRFLQAQTLADITNAQGTRLLTNVMTGAQAPNSTRVSDFNQPRPGDKAWRTWRRFLLTISNRYGVLTNPLNKWTVDVTRVRHWPNTIYDPDADILMTHLQGSLYMTHIRYSPRCFSIQPSDQVVSAVGYPTATNITMDTLRPTLNFISSSSRALPYVDIGISQTIHVHPWEHDLLSHCRQIATQRHITQSISSGTIITCSDGSATSTTASFGFVIATSSGSHLIKGHGPDPGANPNSFRSEAYGVLATMRWLYHAFCHHTPDSSSVIRHYLDNTSVISRIKWTMATTTTPPNHRLLPEQDVIDEIIHTL